MAEGVRAVEELLASPLGIRGILVTPSFQQSERGRAALDVAVLRGILPTEVSELDFLSVADTEHPQGVLAVAETPRHSLDAIGASLGEATRILVLDAVQDPGNAGTLVRTGAALGAQAIVALPGTADLWNAKVVRAAAGAHFRVPALHTTHETLVAFLRAHAIPLWGTAAAGEPVDGLRPPPRLALAVGNEGAGLSDSTVAAAERVVALRMSSNVESLNVAVAAGIVLYVLRS